MRFMSWNICQGTTQKFPLLAKNQIDLAILCEASLEPPLPSMFELAPLLWASAGTLAYKGVVAVGVTMAGRAEPARLGEGRHSVGGILDNGIGVLGIWTCPEGHGKYAPELLKTIDAYEKMLVTRPCIVAGDFNLDPKGSEVPGLKAAFSRLEALGYKSVYHHHNNSALGFERDATHYFRRKRDSRFHIDYVFLPESLMRHVVAVEVGSFEVWVEKTNERVGLSDHVPIIVEFDASVFTSVESHFRQKQAD
jgi:hypothetical protein